MRAALYGRVSTEEQLQGYSIDAQKRAFSVLCQGRGWTPFREYIEEGRSARTENIDKRPVFKKMVADALASEFNIMVVHKLDRFSRNLRLTLEYFEKLSKAGVAFVSISEQVDYSTPSGKVYLAMLGAFAQFYSDNLSEETKKGKRERKAQGLYNGLLPFGTMKGPDKIPVPNPNTHPGLVMAYDLAAQGKRDKEIAAALNAKGFRTAGNRGNRPFTKDTVRDMLPNRFYLGELPDGNGGWVKAKHHALVGQELFEAAQQTRERNRHPREGVNHGAKVYSLSCLMWSQKCGSKMRMQTRPKGQPRVYCAGRANGLGCDCRGTFLKNYEGQIRWYLDTFVIPPDYQERLLEEHRKVVEACDSGDQRAILETRLKRIRELYAWGHKTREEYLADYEEIKVELCQLRPPQDKARELEKLAEFLKSVAQAWDEANQEQRNRLAKTLFDQIWVEDAKLVAVKPRPELKPFFDLNFECQPRDIGCGPDGIRTRDLGLDRTACWATTPRGRLL